MTDARTIQLRRYTIVEGELADFVEWFGSRLIPARQAHGFTIEFAYAVAESDEFVWAVSLPGDTEAFEAVERAYTDSPERRAAFDGVPQRIARMSTAYVQPVVVRT